MVYYRHIDNLIVQVGIDLGVKMTYAPSLCNQKVGTICERSGINIRFTKEDSTLQMSQRLQNRARGRTAGKAVEIIVDYYTSLSRIAKIHVT